MFDKIDLTKLGDRDEQFLLDFAQSAESVSSLSIEFNGFEYCTDIEIFAETTDIMALLQVNVGSSINSNLIHHTTDDEQETIRLAIGKYSPNKHARIVNLDNVLPVLLKDVTFGLKSAIESYL